jgi:crotonobetainyl-CoA:carnitine CoA-transferase CaiB-like acyl-CoA transferase
VRTLGLPVKFSATPGSVGKGAPVLGEHSRDILAEAGYSPREIDDLIKDGAVAEPSRPAGTETQ